MTYKLLAVDMDGTLLTSDKKISPATLNKIAELSRRGVYIAVSTGRALPEVTFNNDALQFMNFGILISGGIIYDFKNSKPLAVHSVEENLILEIIDAGLDEGAMVHLLTVDKSVARAVDIERMENFHMGIYKNMFDKICVRRDDFKKYVRENPGAVVKVNLYHTTLESRNRNVERLKNFELNLTFAESFNLEATPKNISKGSGLIELCKVLNIGVDECVAVGDGFNDIEILQTAGIGAAMGNASDEIKNIADYVTDDNDHDGIVKVIEKFF